jgi:hypothetical protein
MGIKRVHRAVPVGEEDGPGVYCPSYLGVCAVIMVNGHPMCVGCYHSVDKCLPKDYSAFIFDSRRSRVEDKRYWDTYPAEKRDYEAFVADILRRAGDDLAPPTTITNGIVDWTSADESSEVLQGVVPGGWIDPDCERVGSVSRELNSTMEVIQETPFHLQRNYREFSFITLDCPTVEAGKPAMQSAFRKGVITPLIEMKSSPDDNLYGWLDVMFAFCSGKPVAYFSRYVPSDEVHTVAQRHSVTVVHRPLESIPEASLSRHQSFTLVSLTPAEWEELENMSGETTGESE